MTTKSELAKQRFMEGFQCSQAVLEAFSEDFGLDPVLARKLASPFAAGSGMGGVCGAVAGAFMVIGLKYGMAEAGDNEASQNTLKNVKMFADRFRELHENTNCIDLIGLDITDENDRRIFRQKNIKLTRCVNYVEDAVNLLEEFI